MDGPVEPPPSVPAARPADPPDAYEQRYMQGHGAVLFRAKRPAPRWLRRITGGGVLLGVGLAVTAAWPAALVVLPCALAAWAVFSVLRVSVAEGATSVQFGPFGATIPTEAIERAEAIDYDWRAFGWVTGRSATGEQLYRMPGDGGRALRVVWHDRGGMRRVTSVGMPDPEPAIAAIAAAIRVVRATKSGLDEPR